MAYIENLRVDQFTCKTFTPPADSVGDRAFNATDPLTVDKQDHSRVVVGGQDFGAASAAERRIVYIAQSSGTLDAAAAALAQAIVGDSTTTVDLKKNGASVLTAPISLTGANAAYAVANGSIATAAYVPGDVFEVVVAVSAGTGTLGQGLGWAIRFNESAP